VHDKQKKHAAAPLHGLYFSIERTKLNEYTVHQQVQNTHTYYFRYNKSVIHQKGNDLAFHLLTF